MTLAGRVLYVTYAFTVWLILSCYIGAVSTHPEAAPPRRPASAAAPCRRPPPLPPRRTPLPQPTWRPCS